MRIKQTTAVYSTQQIDKYRTHYCGKMSLANEGEVVQLSGWVQSVRTNNFILLRDLHGLVQIFIDDELLKKDDNLAKLKSLSEESVVSVHGLVRRRPKGQENPRMPTGAVEVLCERFELVNKSQTQLPFNISEHNRPNETLRLKYRYLDLRMPEMQHNLILRSKFVHRVRQFMNENGFLDIETPTLFRRTPGGAREFIVNKIVLLCFKFTNLKIQIFKFYEISVN
jgi:aspartyl-tRNA synthetase